MLRFNLRTGNYAQAGQAAAEGAASSLAAVTRKSTDFGKLVQQAQAIRSEKKKKATEVAGNATVAGINAARNVETRKIDQEAKRGYNKARRKAGALGVAGQFFTTAGSLYGEKRDRREVGSEDGFFDLMVQKEKTRQKEIEALINSHNTQTSKPDSPPSGKTGESTSSGVSTSVSAQAGAGPYQMSKEQVRDLALRHGFDPSNAAIAVGVAGGESGRDPTNDTKRLGAKGLYATTGEDSVGLMQINWGYHKDRGWLHKVGVTKRSDLYDPEKNMAAAKYLFDQYGDFRDWTVYDKGIYKGEM